MKTLSVMIKPASAACNLRCKYCFYADISNLREVTSFGRMSQDTMEKMLANIRSELEPGDSVIFAFQGGEPTMAGLDYFRAFTDLVSNWDKGIHVSYALQTNAMLLNDAWCAFLAKYQFLVGVSLDILPECHDAVRVDRWGKGTYRAVCGAVKLLEMHKVEYNVLCTLTNQVARHPKKVWDRMLQLDLRYVQFTPCLDELKKPGESVYALNPKRFAAFYNQIFTYWYADYQKGKYRSIKLFDDVVNLMIYGMPSSCGMNGHCGAQTVIEGDGSVYPCDFYCLDEYRMGNIMEMTISQLRKTPQQIAFQNRDHASPKLCSNCPYRRFCGGNCKRMQREIRCSGEDQFCGYRDFLNTCGNKLQEIAAFERRVRNRV